MKAQTGRKTLVRIAYGEAKRLTRLFQEDRENYQAMAWTYEIRRGSALSPYLRKWPLLLVAGAGREIKVLDGYSGATLKTVQGHGAVGLRFFRFLLVPALTASCCQAITSLAVHPKLPHVVASASCDESISLWDISVPVSMPEVIGTSQNALEEDKRRQGYIAGERICLFAGAGGHVEPVLSIVRVNDGPPGDGSELMTGDRTFTLVYLY